VFDLIFDPRRAFGRIDEFRTPIVCVIYVVILLSMIVLIAAYFHLVDFNWLQAQLASRLREDQRELANKILSPSVLMISSITGRAVKTTLWMGLLTYYYNIVGKYFRSERPASDWLKLAVLSNLPLIALLPTGLLAMMVSSDVQYLPSQLDTTSLAFALSGEVLARWGNTLSQISVVQIWIVVIQAIGIATLLDLRLTRALQIAAIPPVLCICVSALAALV